MLLALSTTLPPTASTSTPLNPNSSLMHQDGCMTDDGNQFPDSPLLSPIYIDKSLSTPEPPVVKHIESRIHQPAGGISSDLHVIFEPTRVERPHEGVEDSPSPPAPEVNVDGIMKQLPQDVDSILSNPPLTAGFEHKPNESTFRSVIDTVEPKVDSSRQYQARIPMREGYRPNSCDIGIKNEACRNDSRASLSKVLRQSPPPPLRVSTSHVPVQRPISRAYDSPSRRDVKPAGGLVHGAYSPYGQPYSPDREMNILSPGVRLPGVNELLNAAPPPVHAYAQPPPTPVSRHHSRSISSAASTPYQNAYYPHPQAVHTSPTPPCSAVAYSPTNTHYDSSVYGSPTRYHPPPTPVQRRTSNHSQQIHQQMPILVHQNSSSSTSSSNMASSVDTVSTARTTPIESSNCFDQHGQHRHLPAPQAMNVIYQCKHEGCTAGTFSTQYLLSSHENVHSQDRPHFCPVEGCVRGIGGKGFKRKNEMMRHGLVHNSPGFVCPFCADRENTYSYPRSDNLLRHVKVHHTDKMRDDPLLRNVLDQGGKKRRRKTQSERSPT